MLYALVDYSNKKFINTCFAEEILGEVKILISKSLNSNKTFKKLIKTIKKYNVQNIVLNNELLCDNILKEKLIDSKKYVVTGKRFGKILLKKILEDVSKYSKIEMEKIKIVLLMNEYSIENLDLVEYISKDIKQLSIVSENYKKYEKTANRLFENYGFTIKLYDAKTREFSRDNIIINIDFKEEELKKMFFNKYSIIISLNERISELRKNFEGIIINDIDILGEGLPSKNFRKLAVCEAKLYRPLRKVKDNERMFKMEKYRINGYIGKNGKITEEDFEKVGKKFILNK